jgi:putative MATE family efflux protein
MTKQVDFEKGSIGQNVIQTAVPMLVAQVLSLLYNIVDRIYIGRIPGEGTAALGGVGLCFPFIMVITAFTNLYGLGGAPLCAMALGRGDKKQAEKILNISFFLLAGTALVLTVTGLIFCRPLLYLFGASDTTIVYALPYLRIYLLGTIASMPASGLNPFINAQGFAGTGMLSIFIGAAANIILDPLFIFTFGWGVRGAAVATVISQCLSAVFVLRFLHGGRSELSLHVSYFRHVNYKTAADITGLGFASFVMQITNSLVAVVCNHMLSTTGGDVYVSVYTIVSSVRQIMDVPVGAINDGASPIMSYNYGAGRYDRIRKTVLITTAWGIGYTCIMWLLVILFPAAFIRIFSSDGTILSTAVPALHLYFFAFVFQALQYSGQTVFKSLNMKKQAIFFSLFRKVIMVVPLTVLLPLIGGLGSQGVFIAEPVSNFIGGTFCFTTMMLTVYRRLGKKTADSRLS